MDPSVATASRNGEVFQLAALAESIQFVYVLVSVICCSACEMTVCAEGVTGV